MAQNRHRLPRDVPGFIVLGGGGLFREVQCAFGADDYLLTREREAMRRPGQMSSGNHLERFRDKGRTRDVPLRHPRTRRSTRTRSMTTLSSIE